ncbi:MAG TPA: polysaccharide deacetylase family protein [Methylomirabilota bacterium]|jgi:peptidoglycan/xylan/chitin deacetylase (PgdA/CDA1 family)|nr:polysaccharide deacetylase family protein [Methylomirabilota bacterium]
MARDFFGYGGQPPHARWPGEARVAVSIVVNVEEGAELALSAGDERNEAVYEVTDEVVGVPDACMESHFEYGTRAGYWRVMDALDRVSVRATLHACGRAVELSPWLAADAVRRGHEVAAHGYRWESHAGLGEAEERARIARAVEAIRHATGLRPVGWHTRSSPSPNTRRLLVEDGGFLYDSDAYSDDLPFFVTVAGRPHLVVPYSFDTNDMHFHQGVQRFVTAGDFVEYVAEAFDCLWREGATAPKMLSVGLHLRMIGRPGRIGALERVITHMRDRGRVWFARRDEIARHWIGLFGVR